MKNYKKLMTAMAGAFPILVVGSFLVAFGNLDILGDYNETILIIGSQLISLFLPIYGGYLVSKDSSNRNFVYGAMIGILSNMFQTGMIGTILGCWITVNLFNYVSKSKKIKSLNVLAITVIYPLILGLLNSLMFIFIIAPITHPIKEVIMQVILINNSYIQLTFGLVFGILMILDLGGPINKTNSLILNALYLEGYTIGAAVKMTGGMVAPVGIGLAKIFMGDARGYKTMAQGASFMTETLIIHSMEDQKNIKIASILGTGLACSLVGFYQIQSYAIQGGLIMAITFSSPLLYIAIFTGSSLFTCITYLLLTRFNKTEEKNEIRIS